MPGDIARTSADLLFADMPTIVVDDAPTQERLEHLLDEGSVQGTLLGASELAAALSGVFLRVTWDRVLAPRPLLTVMQPDTAIPEFRFGMLRAVNFWCELEGSPDNIGRRVPLTEHSETAELADSLDETGDSLTTGIDQLTAAHIPNMLP